MPFILALLLPPFAYYSSTGRIALWAPTMRVADVAALAFFRESLMLSWIPLFFGGFPGWLLFASIASVSAGLVAEDIVKRNLASSNGKCAVLGTFIFILALVVWFAIEYFLSAGSSDLHLLFSPSLEAPPEVFASCRGTGCEGAGIGFALGKVLFWMFGLPLVLGYVSRRGAIAGAELARIYADMNKENPLPDLSDFRYPTWLK